MIDVNNVETWVVVDIETDGPLPGKNSMLSMAAVAFNPNGEVLGDFYENLQELPECSPNPETMKWWATQKNSWELIRQNPKDPKVVMESFEKFLGTFPGKPVLVSFPASFDFSFVHWYALVFLGRLPFHMAGMDIGSFASALLKLPYTRTGRRFWPEEIQKTQREHTHHPLDDAYGHMESFVNLLNYAAKK